MTQPEYGRGYGATDLEAMAQKRVRERIEQLRPELIERGVAVLLAKKKSDEDIEELRKDLHRLVGGDGVRDAMGMFGELAKTLPVPHAFPKMGTDDGRPVVGEQSDALRRTHSPTEGTRHEFQDEVSGTKKKR